MSPRITRVLLLLILAGSWPGWVKAASPAPAPSPIVVLGDSLSAAYQIDPKSGWVELLARRLAAQTPPNSHPVVNASISGDTTAGALARLPKLLTEQRPALVLLELGANDALRGLPTTEIRANLARIIGSCRQAGARVLLIGIEIPVNYGPQYRDTLRAMYRDLAKEFKLPLVPFLLEGVAMDPALMQADGLHPLAVAEPKVLENVWPVLAPELRNLR
jgi:acyl-CoA thioesterase-1